MLQVRVDLHGAVSGAAAFEQSAEASDCTAFADGVSGNHMFTIPSGISTASVDGDPFALNATITTYHGPGSYAAAAFGDPTTTTLTVDQSSSQDPFAPVAPGSRESAVVGPDGSGTFTFADWQDAGLRAESGVLTWACR